MDTFQRALLVGGLAAVLITASASGAAFGSDTGNATVELDTTGLLDTDGGDGGAGGAGGGGCTPSAEISVIGNSEITQAGTSYADEYSNNFFAFESGSFPVQWNPDTCGLSGGSLSLTEFKTEALDNGNWITLRSGFIFNGLPATHYSGVYNLGAIDGLNPAGTFHQVSSNPTIDTADAASESTVTNINLTETLGLTNDATLPNHRYVTTATFSVLADQ